MGKTLHKMKKGAKRVLFVWRALVIVLLSAALIPLFLALGDDAAFYSWIIIPSVAVYLVLTIIHLRFKGGFVKEYLESTATRLFLGLTAVALAFIFLSLGNGPWAAALLVAGAVLYAMFLSRISFLRVIGL